MMKLLVTLLLPTLIVGTTLAPAPAFFWTNSNFFEGHTSELTAASASDVVSVVRGIIGLEQSSTAPLMIDSAKKVERLVLFLFPSLQTDVVTKLSVFEPEAERFKVVGDMIENAGSSLTLPYTYYNVHELETSLKAVAENLPTEYHRSQLAAGDDIKEKLALVHEQSNKLVVFDVTDDSPAMFGEQWIDSWIHRADSQVAEMVRSIAEQVGSRAVAMASKDCEVMPEEFEAHRRELADLVLTVSTESIYITHAIFTGTIVSLFLVVVALCGFCCLMDVQAPTKYEKPDGEDRLG